MKVSAIILAAGSGSRMGTDKMLCTLFGKSVVIHTIEKFLHSERVENFHSFYKNFLQYSLGDTPKCFLKIFEKW